MSSLSCRIKHIAWFSIALLPLLMALETSSPLLEEDDCELNIPELPPITVCETDFDGKALFDLSAVSSLILDSLGEIDNVTPTVFINLQSGGLYKVTELDDVAQGELVCGPINGSITDLAISPEGEFYVLNTSGVAKLDTLNCTMGVSTGLGVLGVGNALSFDPAGNLYAGGNGSSSVYRAPAGEFNNWQPWHDFVVGFPAGDFVMLGEKLYIAWNLAFDPSTSLFEVTVDEDFNYVSHINLGLIKADTYGLASELGSLYGIRYDQLYEISIPDLQLRTVLQHPRAAPHVGDADAWWGGAGLHEARYEISYHLTDQEAIDNQNQIRDTDYENITNPQTLYVRVYDQQIGCEEFTQFELEVFEQPEVSILSPLELCLEQEWGSDFELASLDTVIVADTTGLLISYHQSEFEAEGNSNPITEIEIAPSMDRLYVRVEVATSGCFSTDALDLAFLQKPIMSLFGTSSVCPGVEGVVYEATTSLPVTDYQWNVFGGTIVEETEGRIVVDWGATNAGAFVTVAATYADGCDPDMINQPVVINRELQPAAPQGPASVCYKERTGVMYSVPPVPGSQYRWFVENGTIVGASDQNAVTVNWNAEATGRIYFQEFNPAIAACEGTSDTLTVVVQPELVVVEQVSLPLCNGGADGVVQLSFSAAVDDNQITWSNGATGSLITGLSSGNYSYTLQDENGCSHQGDVTVADHPELTFAAIETFDITCYGAQNGQLRASAQGGFGVHTYIITRNGLDQSNLTGEFNGLAQGEYILAVVDANGCRQEERITITEPPVLRPDLDNIINESICPGSSDGEITVMALGGNAPYTYLWSADPSLNASTITGLSRGDYVLTITDANACQTSLTLSVTEFVPKIFMPTAFTPNDDGDNDVFAAVSGCTPTTFSMTMYNRWGNVIFYSEDISKGWDGTFEGQPVPVGLYTYGLAYSISVNGNLVQETFKGEIRLIR